jgi:tetratricopeptide (TPR) repeat protein
MTLDPLNELLVVNYSTNLAVRGDWQTAKSLLQGLVDLRPASSVLLRSMASHEMSHGHLAEGWRFANRSHSLEPGNPSDISVLVQAWLSLGQFDKAEQLLQAGLAELDQNESLMKHYWGMLVQSKRFEEAKSMTADWQKRAGDDLPPNMLLKFNYQRGMIAMLEGDYQSAYTSFATAAESKESSEYREGDIMTLTMTALAAGKTDREEEFSHYLSEAERTVQRARLNGVDDSSIYYSEATILALRNNSSAALEKLQTAYDKGFRELWWFSVDGRLDGLRDEPAFATLQDRIQGDIDQALSEIRTRSAFTKT